MQQRSSNIDQAPTSSAKQLPHTAAKLSTQEYYASLVHKMRDQDAAIEERDHAVTCAFQCTLGINGPGEFLKLATRQFSPDIIAQQDRQLLAAALATYCQYFEHRSASTLLTHAYALHPNSSVISESIQSLFGGEPEAILSRFITYEASQEVGRSPTPRSQLSGIKKLESAVALDPKNLDASRKLLRLVATLRPSTVAEQFSNNATLASKEFTRIIKLGSGISDRILKDCFELSESDLLAHNRTQKMDRIPHSEDLFSDLVRTNQVHGRMLLENDNTSAGIARSCRAVLIGCSLLATVGLPISPYDLQKESSRADFVPPRYANDIARALGYMALALNQMKLPHLALLTADCSVHLQPDSRILQRLRLNALKNFNEDLSDALQKACTYSDGEWKLFRTSCDHAFRSEHHTSFSLLSPEHSKYPPSRDNSQDLILTSQIERIADSTPNPENMREKLTRFGTLLDALHTGDTGTQMKFLQDQLREIQEWWTREFSIDTKLNLELMKAAIRFIEASSSEDKVLKLITKIHRNERLQEFDDALTTFLTDSLGTNEELSIYANAITATLEAYTQFFARRST